MINKLKGLIVQLPVIKMILNHREERCRAEDEKRELLERQHDIARRVHVVEWMSYPHTQKANREQH